MVPSNDHHPARSSRATWTDERGIKQLFTHFDRLMQSPQSVQRLRRFILDLAVRGKLVPQDPKDEPASELLKRIAKEKARLVKAGAIKRQRRLPSIDKIPYSIPASWCWTRIREITSDRGQCVPEATFTYIDVTSIDKEKGKVAGPKVLQANEAPSRARKVVQKGDVIYSCVRPYLLNVAVVEDDFDPKPISSTAFAVLNGHKLVLPRYLWIVLRSPFMVSCVEENMRGQAYPAINDTDFSILPFPLPPLPEQRSLVAKVDQLMEVCDQLEAAQAERETRRTHLTATSLARLSASEPGEARFRERAAFALDNFTPLTTRPEQVKALRRIILNLAVRGKLVPQDPEDEPVTTLLKRQKIAIPSGEAFKVPTSWAWVNVGMVAKARLGKMLDKAKNKGTLRKYLRNINVRWLDFDLTDLLEMRFEDSELQEFSLQSGDVMVCEGGEPGRAAVWDGRESDIYFQKAIHRIRFLDIVAGEYFVRALQASVDDGRLVEYFTGTGIKHFTGKALNSYLFPLPPLAEQRRIVTKVDKLMGLCDRLEGSLEAGDEGRGLLADTLLCEAISNVGIALDGGSKKDSLKNFTRTHELEML